MFIVGAKFLLGYTFTRWRAWTNHHDFACHNSHVFPFFSFKICYLILALLDAIHKCHPFLPHVAPRFLDARVTTWRLWLAGTILLRCHRIALHTLLAKAFYPHALYLGVVGSSPTSLLDHIAPNSISSCSRIYQNSN
jgi:hypothetical protein